MIEPNSTKDEYKTTKDLTIKGFYIPAGFAFDGMSAPWFLRSVLGGPYRPRTVMAVILHDYLYSTKNVSRKQADHLFYKMLKHENVKCSFLFYLGVRAFGWMHY